MGRVTLGVGLAESIWNVAYSVWVGHAERAGCAVFSRVCSFCRFAIFTLSVGGFVVWRFADESV